PACCGCGPVPPAGGCSRARRDFPDVVRRVCPVATVRVCPATAITPVQLVGGGCGGGERVPRVLFGGVFVGPEGCCRVQVERCVDRESGALEVQRGQLGHGRRSGGGGGRGRG